MKKFLIEKEVKLSGTNIILEKGDSTVLNESIITKQYAQNLANQFSKGLDFLKDR